MKKRRTVSLALRCDVLAQGGRPRAADCSQYRRNGHPTAVLHFQSDQREMTVQLQDLRVQQGSIVIRGKPVESGPTRAAALPASRPVKFTEFRSLASSAVWRATC